MLEQTPPPEKKQDQEKNTSFMQKLQHPSFFKGFSIASKLVLFVPIAIILLALFLRLYDIYVSTPRQAQIEREREIRIQQQQKPEPTAQLAEEEMLQQFLQRANGDEVSTESSMIDLSTPQSCSLSLEGQDIQAYIKNEQVYAEISATDSAALSYIVLSDDCLYQWQSNAVEGTQFCGISTFRSLLSSFLQLSPGGGSLESTLFSMLPQMGVSSSVGSDFSLEELENSCVEEDVSDEVFIIPETVRFSEESLGNFGL